jgi:hypothetical protein
MLTCCQLYLEGVACNSAGNTCAAEPISINSA